MMRSRPAHPGLVLLPVLLSACGGSGVGPSPVSTPTATHPVTVTTFLDENANGIFDAAEGTRIPNVEIVIGSARGATAVGTGQATLQAPEGAQSLTVTAASLPPFYRPPSAPIPVTVPAGGPVMVPITLPRGSNRANVYMAFGDSITNGEPEVPDGNGYRGFLQAMLRAHFGAGEIANEGRDGTNSDFGASIISTRLAAVRPAFTLIHYGTNDWNRSVCDSASKVPEPCYTTASLRTMVQEVNRSGGHAFLATIIPVNVGYDGRTPPERQDWVDQVNVTIKQIANEEGAVLVDLNDAFKRSGLTGSALYVDHLHPTTAGYQIMAQTWFTAISKAYSKILSE